MLARDGSLTYSNGGHNAPILVRATSVRRLETGGVVLGLFEHASYEEETLTLAPGDVIVAFSDGVSEALNEAGEEFTDERLLGSIAKHASKPPQELLDGAARRCPRVLRRRHPERRRHDRRIVDGYRPGRRVCRVRHQVRQRFRAVPERPRTTAALASSVSEMPSAPSTPWRAVFVGGRDHLAVAERPPG